ncbi:MAG TPA: GH92 family glycosyl hydrolase [Polyangiaceae bacterium]|nr:GH92 family glycosyl hydrolase [Polyangiaceae bacterium]
MLARVSFFAVLVAVACSSSGPPDVVGVDGDDVQCDPLDAIDDDSSQPAIDTPLPLTQWVDPFVGTGGVAFGVGTTYPGPQVPLGMVRPGPDTSSNGGAADFMHCSGYSYADDTIEAFSEMRVHSAGIADYGGAGFMPVIGMTAAKSAPHGHGSHFSHSTETAQPGYYAVTLDDTQTRVELTATTHVALHRYTFPQASDATVVVDLGHVMADGNSVTSGTVTIDVPAQTVSGVSHVMGSYSSRYGGLDIYFAARFDAPFVSFGTFSSGTLTDASTSATGADVGAYLHFDATTKTTFEAHIGVSLVDGAHALANLVAEDTTFEAARAAADQAWEARLGRARIRARSDHDRRIFYTALYHTALMPALSMDTDGSYRGIDGNVHTASGFRYFSDFSLWDTYRTLHPFITLLYPEDAADLAASLVQMGKDGGFIPRWPIGPGEAGGMVGDGGTIVLADTYVKGVTSWDTQGGYAIAKQQATVPAAPSAKGGREDLADWLALGYYPAPADDSVAKTLEYGAADDALGTWAAAMGQQADADTFHARGKGWQKLYDPASHFIFPKTADGTMTPALPTAMGGPYTEGDAWQYNFMVPYDTDGLVAAMTRPVLLGRVEQLFTRFACTGKSNDFPNPYYWPSNEPDLFSGWVFGAVGDPVRAGRWLRWTTLTHFDDTPAGLPGNDDSGTMSAFYLFASLGFYPVPGADRYVLGSPLFPYATLATPTGTITVDAPAASKKTRFAKSVTLGGAPIAAFVHHGDLVHGATLHFEMTATP